MTTVWTTCRLCGCQRVPFGYVGDVVGSVCTCRFEGPAGTGYGVELQRLIGERQLAERDARIAQLQRELDEANAATKTLREAAGKLLEACDTSDDCRYGTLSTSFVRQVLGERGTDRDALIAQLERALDEAMRDSRRYRWLRDWLRRVGLLEHINAAHRPDGTHGPTTILRRPAIINGSELVGWSAGVGQGFDDAAIDAAMTGGM